MQSKLWLITKLCVCCTLLLSVSVRYLMFPPISLKASLKCNSRDGLQWGSSTTYLLSFHCCLNVIWRLKFRWNKTFLLMLTDRATHLNSILTSSIFSKLLTNRLTKTFVGPSRSISLLLPPFGLEEIHFCLIFKTPNFFVHLQSS